MLSRMLVAGRHFHAHDEARPRQHIGVKHVRRPARFFRIVADDRPFLMPIEQFYRRIDIDDIILAKQWRRAQIDVFLHPVCSLVLGHRLQAVSDRILADDLRHAEHLGQHRIGTQRRDVGIPSVARQHRQHRRAE